MYTCLTPIINSYPNSFWAVVSLSGTRYCRHVETVGSFVAMCCIMFDSRTIKIQIFCCLVILAKKGHSTAWWYALGAYLGCMGVVADIMVSWTATGYHLWLSAKQQMSYSHQGAIICPSRTPYDISQIFLSKWR